MFSNIFCKTTLPVNVVRNGQRGNIRVNISKLAFVKHFAFAGLGFAPRVQKWKRLIGSLLLYSPYMSTFCQGHFVDPFYDPTAKAQFSNLVGKAIADFLSKQIDGAVLTFSYEWVMRKRGLQVRGSRPDLLALLKGGVKIAIEAKGYSRGPGNMRQHKTQALSGPLPARFAVASVAYNLYSQIKVNNWDPEREDEEGADPELWRILSKGYYSGLFTFLESGVWDVVDRKAFKGEGFYVLGLRRGWWERFAEYFRECLWCWGKCCEWEWPWAWERVFLLLPERIKEFADEGLPVEIKPFMFEGEESLYIDNDRVGILFA